MNIKYTDGIQDVVIKTKNAYHYKTGTSILMGQSNASERRPFINKLVAAGFKRAEDQTDNATI